MRGAEAGGGDRGGGAPFPRDGRRPPSGAGAPAPAHKASTAVSSRQEEALLETEGKLVIGWKESVCLVDWGLTRIRAKIDTGARTSSLHAHRVERLGRHRDAEGREREWVRVAVTPSRRRAHRLHWIELPVLRYKVVKSSSGHRQLRPFVRARIRLGDQDVLTELSLTNREPMIFRLILGRKFLADRFLVDVSRQYVQSRGPRRIGCVS